ncbi:probable L-type lectin-domain containing receptor kinase S.5 [Eucalyptus grandis]|uniref:probable L-type lectin-domain containing receptor kinase S.5 n=1 Tax=Eucalyptus grandis TaxID=71139 RepID=UPI00192E87D7|nr:probable L-type lectin-domain containing receptor kinase S.5 [Eucalyptus grandis]
MDGTLFLFEVMLAVRRIATKTFFFQHNRVEIARVSCVQTMFLLPILVSLFLGSQQAYSSTSSSSLEPTSFFFPSFDHGSCTGKELICMGSVSSRDGYLNITPEKGNSSLASMPTNQVGRVLYSQPVAAWPAMISTTFTVRITPPPNSTVSGDGMAFLFAQDNSPSPPNSTGSYMGILDRSTQGGVVRQLAVELDTYMNEFDIDGNHIGIDTTSTTNSVVAQSLKSTGVNLRSGRDITVEIEYDGYKNEFQILIAYSGNSLTSVLNYSIKMSETVPRLVYVGFSGGTGPLPESHQVINWAFSSFPLSTVEKRLKRDNRIKTILVLVVPSVMTVLFIIICVYLVKRAPRKRDKKDTDIESQSRVAANIPKMFTYKELAKATRNFSKENLLGTGGFGSVYKGVISDPPVEIAVKKISATSKQGERQYLAEICTIGRMRHKNIVQLQGWCHEGEQLLLVYQYMANGSLDRFIGKLSLNWETRYEILTGIASALLYLHEECGNPVVHRDIKPNNVMLDANYNAYLGDFGLARLIQSDASSTTMLAGTPGYLAPEVAYLGKATPESDVYSFGMVVLEVVCGKRSKGITEENNLVDYVWSLYGEDSLLECVDEQMEGQFDEEQVERALIVGLACLHPYSACRPRMRKVVQIFLNPDEPLMELPKSRPSMAFVPVSFSGLTTVGYSSTSRTKSAFARSPLSSPQEIELNHE